MTPPTFDINGFITGKDVADVADDGDEAVSKQWRVSGPAWTGLRLTDGSGGFDDAFVAPRVLGAACQLEDADLSAGLIVSSDHRVFDGTGYTEGWGTAGARTTGGPGGDRGAAVRGRGALLRGRPRQRRKGDTAADAEGGRGLQHPRAAGHGGLRGLDRGPCPDHGRRGTAHAHPGRPRSADTRVNLEQIAVVPVGAAAPAPAPFTADGVLAGYRQSLDLRTGAIATSATWTSPEGNVSDVEYTVLTDRSDDQRALVRLAITPRFSGEITVTDVLVPARSTRSRSSCPTGRPMRGGSAGLRSCGTRDTAPPSPPVASARASSPPPRPRISPTDRSDGT